MAGRISRRPLIVSALAATARSGAGSVGGVILARDQPRPGPFTATPQRPFHVRPYERSTSTADASGRNARSPGTVAKPLSPETRDSAPRRSATAARTQSNAPSCVWPS